MNPLRKLFSRAPLTGEKLVSGPVEVYPTTDGGAVVQWRGERSIAEEIRMKANEVHALLRKADGTIVDLGVSHNLRTTAGIDWQSDTMGGRLGIAKTASASSATSITTSGLTSAAHVGWRVYADNGTAAPVFGNVLSNTTTVIQVDGWWNPDGTAGSTPSSTANFTLIPQSGAYWVGITANTGAPAAGDTALTGEITTSSLNRKAGTYAHTPAATSYTIAVTFTATGTPSDLVHKAGLFTGGFGASGGGVMAFESNLNADALMSSAGDQLTLTWTVNI